VLGASVLILDDDPGMRSFLQRGLARLFALVEVAADTATAQELIRRCHFDLLIADIRLPGRTGIDWVRELWEQGSRPGCGLHHCPCGPADRDRRTAGRGDRFHPQALSHRAGLPGP